MALADVEAILSGDRARLDGALLRELENSEDWPENVKAGVAHYARRSNSRNGYNEEPEYVKLYDCIEKGFSPRTKSLWLATATPMQIDPIEVYDLTKLMGRTADFRYEPYLLEQYYELLAKIAQDKTLNIDDWRLLGKSFAALEATDPYLLRLLEKTVVNGKNRQALQDLTMRAPRGKDTKEVLRPLFAAAPLSRVMMRHTRKLLEEYRKHGELKSNLAKRHVLKLDIIPFSPMEKEFYGQLEAYCAGLMQQINAHKPDLKQIFTRFFDSLQSIREYLDARAPGLHVGVYSGKETKWYDEEARCYRRVSREEIKSLFLDGKIDVLLCTDAAAEGLNLQTADLLINFDMGWNPMKIEQRIGRIDRIGQKHKDIYVLNMCYQDSTEEIVYGRLTSRLKKAGQIVGEQQISLLPIEPQDFVDLHLGKIDEKKLEKIARNRLKKQRENAQKMELSAEAQYEIYKQEHKLMAQKKQPASVDDLQKAIIDSAYLQSLGLATKELGDGLMVEMSVCGETSGWQGTTSRNMASAQLPFITWGNKAVDGLLGKMSERLEAYGLYVRRISVPLAGGESVGYLVATDKEPVLVTSYEMLDKIKVAKIPLTDVSIQEAKEKLACMVAEEQVQHMQKETIRQVNEEYASIHRELVKYVAIGMLGKTGEELVLQAIKKLEEQPRKTYTLLLPNKMNEFRNRTLFTVTSSGGNTYITTTPSLNGAAIALCQQVSARLAKHKKNKKKKEQTCRDIIDFLSKNG